MSERTPARDGSAVPLGTARLPDPRVDDGRGGVDPLEAVWQEYKATKDEHLRERLILHYSPLVKYVAGRVAVGLPQNVEQADLVSYGIFATCRSHWPPPVASASSRTAPPGRQCCRPPDNPPASARPAGDRGRAPGDLHRCAAAAGRARSR